jgi:hypothetical protein
MKNGRTPESQSTAADISTRKATTANSATIGEQLAIRIDDGRTLVIEIRARIDIADGSGVTRSLTGPAAANPMPTWGTRTAWREQRVLKALQQLGYEPTALAPLPGSPRIEAKRQVFARLVFDDGPHAWNATSFEKCWQAMRSAGLVADAVSRRRALTAFANAIRRPRTKGRKPALREVTCEPVDGATIDADGDPFDWPLGPKAKGEGKVPVKALMVEIRERGWSSLESICAALGMTKISLRRGIELAVQAGILEKDGKGFRLTEATLDLWSRVGGLLPESGATRESDEFIDGDGTTGVRL